MNKFHSSVDSVMTMVTSPETAKKTEDKLEKEKSPWTQIQKPGQSNQVKRKIGNEGKAKIGVHADGKNVEIPNLVSNKFVVLSSMDDSGILEQGELHHVQDDEAKANTSKSNIVSNNLAALTFAEDSTHLEEGELHHSTTQEDIPEASTRQMDLSGEDCLAFPRVGELLNQNPPSPKGAQCSPSYAEVTMKKPLDISVSSSDESI